MKSKNGFTLIEKPSEIGEYLRKQKVTRKITRLQVHHMDLPNYDTWEKTDKKVFDEPHFGRTESLDDYGKRTWDSKSANGKYIAQHFNVFPDGKITTGRSLNSTPIGIKGWNTNAICIEIYGDFDKGEDVMNKAQKEAIIALYGELCKKFDLTPNSNNIRCHCWFTSGGTYLNGYYPSKSAKTCPGTNFTKAFGGTINGYGNSKDAFEKFFYPAIKKYISGEGPSTSKPAGEKFQVKVLSDTLNVRKVADWDAEPITKVKKGQYLDVIDTVNAKNGSTKMYKLESGLYITSSDKYVKKV